MRNKEYWNKWTKAAGMRAVKTMAQTFIATASTAVVMGDVNWAMTGSATLLSGILSLATSIMGLPELKVPELPESDEG
jgi:hypothetical protein